jgi:hypothetical protein
LTEVLSWFSSVPEAKCCSTLKLGHNRFLPRSFQFIFLSLPLHSMLYSESLKSVFEQTATLHSAPNYRIPASILWISRLSYSENLIPAVSTQPEWVSLHASIPQVKCSSFKEKLALYQKH